MQIQLPKAPRWIIKIIDWLNIPIYTWHEYEVRYIDILLVILGIASTVYYWHFYGWLTALQSAALFCFLVMLILWF